MSERQQEETLNQKKMHLFLLSFFFVFFLLIKRFTNEDHLSVHKHKHEMTLKFGPARTDSVIIAGNHTSINNNLMYS